MSLQVRLNQSCDGGGCNGDAVVGGGGCGGDGVVGGSCGYDGGGECSSGGYSIVVSEGLVLSLSGKQGVIYRYTKEG